MYSCFGGPGFVCFVGAGLACLDSINLSLFGSANLALFGIRTSIVGSDLRRRFNPAIFNEKDIIAIFS